MLHYAAFIWVFTVCKNTHLGVPKYKGLKKHDCEDGTEKSVLGITVWHHEADIVRREPVVQW